VKVQEKMRLNARMNNLPDPQYFGINLAWIEPGKLNWKAAVGLDTYEHVPASGIRKSRHAAKKLDPLLAITFVEDLCLVFNVQTLADLIVNEGLQVSGANRFERLVQQGHG
jgi:hypothetical protein